MHPAPNIATRGLAVELHNDSDMEAVQSFKLVVNLGNAINALVGKPLLECMKQRSYRTLLAHTWAEGLAVMKASGTRLHGDVNGQPLEKVIKLLQLPDLLIATAQRLKGVKAVDPSYHSSMFYDLEHHRVTEVDELNERVASMGDRCGIATPLNTLLTRLTRDAQDARQGSPQVTAEAILQMAGPAFPGGSSSILSERTLLLGCCVGILGFAASKL